MVQSAAVADAKSDRALAVSRKVLDMVPLA